MRSGKRIFVKSVWHSEDQLFDIIFLYPSYPYFINIVIIFMNIINGEVREVAGYIILFVFIIVFVVLSYFSTSFYRFVKVLK